MKSLAASVLFSVILFSAFLFLGCSGVSDNPIIQDEQPKLEPVGNSSDTTRVLWGIWSITYDTGTAKVSVIPDRNILAHFNITDMIIPPACDDCMEIAVNSFDTVTREMDVDVTLRNPYLISGKDVRGILYTDDAGHLILNPDDWTGLWDIPGGHVKNINPFKAFAKTVPNHVFGAELEYTENYIVHIPKPPSYATIRFAVDACWPGNCKEPFVIENFLQLDDLLEITGYSAWCQVNVRDWQNDVADVVIRIPEITGDDSTSFTDLGADLWAVLLYNNEGAVAGDYTGLVIAKSANSGDTALYDEVTVTVTEPLPPEVTGIEPEHGTVGTTILEATISGNHFIGTGSVVLKMSGEPPILCENESFVDEHTITCTIDIPYGQTTGAYDVVVTNFGGLFDTGVEMFEVLEQKPYYPTDVTPEWLNYNANDVAITDHYALIAGSYNGIQLIDIDNPAGPMWVANVPTDDRAWGITIVGDYAYVADYYGGLKIVNITPEFFGDIDGSVSSIGQANKVAVQGGHAFVASYTAGLKIIDVDPPESAEVVKTVATGHAFDVAVEGGYAYVADGDFGLRIVDIDPIEEASVVKTVDPGDFPVAAIAVSNGYAYLANKSDGLQIVDIDPVESASVVHNVDPGYLVDVAVSGDYLYATERTEGLFVIDISTPETASVITSLGTGCWSYGITIDHDYAYIADPENGLRIVDISTPATPTLVSTAYGMGYVRDVEYSGGYAYVANTHAGMFVLGAMPPPHSFFIGAVDAAEAKGLCVDNGYVYLADWTSTFKIIDISTPTDPVITKEVTHGGVAYDVVIYNGHAFVADGTAGVKIIDVDPVADASVVKTVATPGRAVGIAVAGGHAYVVDESEGLQIIDIDPVLDSSIIHSVDTTGNALGVALDSNYAYIAETIDGLVIIDITVPGSASLENTIAMPSAAKGVFIDGEFAYVCCGVAGLQIVDVENAGVAYIFSAVDTPSSAANAWIEGPYAFVADEYSGLRIIQLW